MHVQNTSEASSKKCCWYLNAPGLSIADAAVDEGAGDLLKGLQNLITSNQDLRGKWQDAGLQLLTGTRSFNTHISQRTSTAATELSFKKKEYLV